MNYHVRRRGEYLGCFPLEELVRRRDSGEFTGVEYVQAEGTNDWQPMGMVLKQGYRTTPPPVPQTVVRHGPNPALVWGGVAGGVILCVLFVGVMAVMMARFQRNDGQRNYDRAAPLDQRSSANAFNELNPHAVATAGKPIIWSNDTLTVTDERKRQRAFRFKVWVDGYEKYGRRNPECDAEAGLFLRAYVAHYYGGPETTNFMSLAVESDKLAGDTNCTDPLVLTVAAAESLNRADSIHRFRRALAAYPGSSHKACPQFYATVRLAGLLGYDSDQAGPLQTSALQLLKQCFTDGSFTTDDQQDIADMFINGWGYRFFQRNALSVCDIASNAGPQYRWLSATLNGEHEVVEAWAARGGGYGNTVADKSWTDFHLHLGAARRDFTDAWQMEPNWPIAPERMIYVSLGDSDLDEMRIWFDRTTRAQIDYPRAWIDLRLGLHRRWYGNEKAMLALGVAAINTGRYDTDVPRKYIDCIYDAESEMGVPFGKHIFGRDDIWPNVKRMYDGYINAPSQKEYLRDWRTSYAVTAYFAGRYDVARAQLEALDWNPVASAMENWKVDLSLMPLEVAARTGPLGVKVSEAERTRERGDFSKSMKDYAGLKEAPEADDRTRQFIQCRLSELSAEQRLNAGEWIGLLPSRDDDPDWVFSQGKVHVLPDSAVEVESGSAGHMFYSRVRAGTDFEVRGQFELVRSGDSNFEGGVVMGVPDFRGYNWYGFRIERQKEEGDVACFSRGWSRPEIIRHIVLNDVTNSFDLTFEDGKVTASVNGIDVLEHADPPAEIDVPDSSFLVGLGAFGDSPGTVIRYRNVQLRTL